MINCLQNKPTGGGKDKIEANMKIPQVRATGCHVLWKMTKKL